jgi:hypothetical protein
MGAGNATGQMDRRSQILKTCFGSQFDVESTNQNRFIFPAKRLNGSFGNLIDALVDRDLKTAFG